MSETDTNHFSRNSLLGRLGMDIRGIVVVLLCVTICILTSMGKTDIPKELYWLTSAAVTYYFGQKHNAGNSDSK